MKIICLQIGNTDDKLPQAGWHNFCSIMDAAIKVFAENIYFYGPSKGDESWQNACWVFDIPEDKAPLLMKDAKRIREIFMQESIAWMEGNVRMI